MIARRPVLVILGLLCVLVCVLAAGVASAGAAVPEFGSGPGSNPGEFRYPRGVAIDRASGDVYVADFLKNVVEKFDAAGGFLSAWGSAGEGAGEFADEAGASGVAIDNELGSLSYGDVYVVDWQNFRVEKFDSEGKFLLMFGGGVNEKSPGGDVCVAGEACKKGSEGSADGQFEWSYGGSNYIAVGPDGRVYVGDKARVQVFEPSGAWRENISLAGLSSTAKVYALAVDSSGDVFVKDEGVTGVREFEPDGSEVATQFDAGSTTVQSLAVNGSGDLFVGDSNGGFHLLEFDPAGGELESFGSKTLENSYGMAFAETSGELYVSGLREVSGPYGPIDEPKVWVFTPPPPGPFVEAGSVSVTAGLRGHAAFDALVNPEGSDTTYRYEYVDQAQFEVNGYASAASTSGVSIGSGFEGQQAHASVEGLIPGDTYHYRLLASNANGTVTGADQVFEEIPPALVDGPWAVDVTSSSATLAASIDPLGASTAYRLEWGASASYGHLLSGNVGEGMTQIQSSFQLQELVPGTTYHYRLVTVNEVGTIEGVDRTFTTQTAGGEHTLPDGRAWELVSPPDKKGAEIGPFDSLNEGRQNNVVQAANDGSGIAYPTEGPAVGENPASRSEESFVLSRRGAGGWSSTDIDMPRRNVKEGESAYSILKSSPGELPFFSPDLSSVIAEPSGNVTPLLSPEATERTLYVRDNTTGSYLPLVTPADVPPGTRFGGEESVIDTIAGSSENLTMQFLAATPDLGHVVFESPLALTSNAVAANPLGSRCEVNGKTVCGLPNLYEWGGGRLQLVSILPDGAQVTEEPPRPMLAGEGAYLKEGLAERPVSADGRWVAWSWGTPYGPEGTHYRGLYVRDMVDEKTFQVGGPDALYQSMSSDGAHVFFLEHGELYEYNTTTQTQLDLTSQHGAGEANAGVQESVSDISESGSYVYFVAKGVLARGGVSGEDNLYLLHENDGGWATTYIATLSREDEKSWRQETTLGGAPDLAEVSSRVSPDGRYLAFMSDRSLTGYDNLDANSGQPDEEVYLYDAVEDRLVCASCDPSGARPVGVLDATSTFEAPILTVDPLKSWGSGSGHWLAGSLPGWDTVNGPRALYQPRYLSDGGRLLFDSADALVPKDTNGLEDVYEYEPPSSSETLTSDSCTTSSPAFSSRSSGCVNLISSGTSGSESVFYDASESGDDVFFISTSRLVSSDYDDAYDVYDAHVCSAQAPCVAEPVSSPPCTSGDSCKAAPSPQPEIFGPAPSATFSGIGNVIEETKPSVVKHKRKAKAKPRKRTKQKKHKASRKARKTRAGGASGRRGK